jgi:hypothetical protein
VSFMNRSVRLSSNPGSHADGERAGVFVEGIFTAMGLAMLIFGLIVDGRRNLYVSILLSVSCPPIFDLKTSTVSRIVHPHQCHPDVHLGRNFEILHDVSGHHSDRAGATTSDHRAFGLMAGAVLVAASNRSLPAIKL